MGNFTSQRGSSVFDQCVVCFRRTPYSSVGISLRTCTVHETNPQYDDPRGPTQAGRFIASLLEKATRGEHRKLIEVVQVKRIA